MFTISLHLVLMWITRLLSLLSACLTKRHLYNKAHTVRFNMIHLEISIWELFPEPESKSRIIFDS